MQLPNVERIALRDIEICDPIEDLGGLDDYQYVCLFVRLASVPVGHVTVPVNNGVANHEDMRQAIFRELKHDLARLLVEQLLQSPAPDRAALAPQRRPHAVDPVVWPLVTVAVCTRDRPEDLERCLRGLCELDYPALDLVVIDNAPKTDASARVVANFPRVRYVLEPRPGLDWARNRAINEARGEIVAYTDDDVVVDRLWVRALAKLFAEHANVMAITGLVIPLELESNAQIQFERVGGFGRGVQRRWVGVNLPSGERAATHNAGTGKFGTGANMAFRRSVFERIGLFDPALDVGTVTNGGGDLEMFFRVLKAGFLLVYEPQAVVRHRHRRDFAQLCTQIANNGVGFYSYAVRGMLHFRDERVALGRTALWWLGYWSGRRFLGRRGDPVDRELARVEFFGSLRGLRTYQRARRSAEALAGGKLDAIDRLSAPRRVENPQPHSVAIRRVEIEALVALNDVTRYPATRVFVSGRGRLLGHIDINNYYSPISVEWLKGAIAEWLWLPIAELMTGVEGDRAVEAVLASFSQTAPESAPRPVSQALSPETSVSVVIATFDRPRDLRTCLQSLMQLTSRRSVELVVVDNHPSSGLTAPVVAQFPSVRLVNEERQGLSYARNCGVLHATGDIILCTDDDVVVAPDWVERLVAPFARPEVHAVTGNVLPIELDTVPQQLFERYGGLGRGYVPREVGGEWFRSCHGAVPTWTLGATANAAFRASVFVDPEIGLFCEALGPGTPTGVGEDTYLFYKILKKNHVIVYEPGAVVWHRHRYSMEALRNQIFSYSKGHVAYHLHTWANDGDARALGHILHRLPAWRVKQLSRLALDTLRGKNPYPAGLSLLEMGGNLLGPPELVLSYARVRRLGRSRTGG